MAYIVSLKDFDGPLDLLLTLITRAKIDIQDIFVSEITEQYLETMKGVEELDMVELYEDTMPISYIYPGALDGADSLKSLTLGKNTIMEKADMDRYDGDLYYYDGYLSASWLIGHLLTDFIAEVEGCQVELDLDVTRVAQAQINEYYVRNMDENFWVDLLYDADVDYSRGTGRKAACSDEEMIDILCDLIVEVYEDTQYARLSLAYSYSDEDGVEFLLICYNP